MKTAIAVVLGCMLILIVIGSIAISENNVNVPENLSLIQDITAIRDTYPIGEEIKFLYAIRNKSDKPLTYSFSSSKQFDLWITRGPREVYRLGSHQMYAQSLTSLTLQPGETKTFEITWNQISDDGKPVGPGVYEVYAQLTPINETTVAVKAKVQIGGVSAAVIPISVKQAIDRINSLKDRRVQMQGTYKGYQPDPNDKNTKDGPPLTRSDWAICDDTGCLYVTGTITLDPEKDIGRKISVTGKLQKASNGQVYLILESADIQSKP